MMIVRAAFPLLLVLTTLAAACGGQRPLLPPGTAQADEFLFKQGEAEFQERRWIRAREYYRQIVDNYPQSPFRPDAKLALGDTYIGEGNAEALVLAANEFREFLTFYPTHARADYAQYRLAVSNAERMLAPERDQTATRETIAELETFIERYPNSALMAQVQALMRDAKDRLSEAGYRVGVYYYRARWYIGAIDRFREVLEADPGFTRRDAVYYHLAESLFRSDRKAEALPYYERLLAEFEQSEYLDEARTRVAELKGGAATGR